MRIGKEIKRITKPLRITNWPAPKPRPKPIPVPNWPRRERVPTRKELSCTE